MRRIRVAGEAGGARLGAPIQAEALAYFARMTTPPSAAFRDAVNWAIWRWKAIGAWSQIAGLWILAADTAQAALLSVNGDTPRDAVTVGTSPTFTALKGYSGFDATHQVKFPITSGILASDAVCAVVAARLLVRNDGAGAAVVGNFIGSDAGGSSAVIGHFNTVTGLGSSKNGVYGGSPSGDSPIEPVGINIGDAISLTVGVKSGFVIRPGGVRAGGVPSSRSSNYLTSPLASTPLERLSAYGFLASTATTAQCRQFLAVLAAMLDQLGALD